jgi:hypothetical protein
MEAKKDFGRDRERLGEADTHFVGTFPIDLAARTKGLAGLRVSCRRYWLLVSQPKQICSCLVFTLH